MALCCRCLAIPFRSLPPPHPARPPYRVFSLPDIQCTQCLCHEADEVDEVDEADEAEEAEESDESSEFDESDEADEVDEADENDEESEHALGYPWHPDLDSLAASASDCALCQVVHKGVQNWLRKFKEGKAKDHWKIFAKKFAYPLPEGRVLYLTQRYGGGPGFNIMVETKRAPGDTYILPGVAFSVDESRLQAHFCFPSRIQLSEN
jgi:hypothetical protein